MNHLVSAMLIIVGLIHLLPLSGVLGGEKLSALYGLSVNEPNLVILMRHRAVLFGLLGAFFVFAAFRREFQPLAFIAAYVSVISFLYLSWSTGNYNAQIARVFTADIVALACLIIGSFAYWYVRAKR